MVSQGTPFQFSLVGSVTPLSQSLICIDPIVVYQKFHRLESPKVLAKFEVLRSWRCRGICGNSRRVIAHADPCITPINSACTRSKSGWFVSLSGANSPLPCARTTRWARLFAPPPHRLTSRTGGRSCTTTRTDRRRSSQRDEMAQHRSCRASPTWPVSRRDLSSSSGTSRRIRVLTQSVCSPRPVRVQTRSLERDR